MMIAGVNRRGTVERLAPIRGLDFVAADGQIDQQPGTGHRGLEHRRLLLVFSIVGNLGLLGVFKYLEGGQLSGSRTLIVGDVNSQAVYIEEYISPAKVASSVNTSRKRLRTSAAWGLLR